MASEDQPSDMEIDGLLFRARMPAIAIPINQRKWVQACTRWSTWSLRDGQISTQIQGETRRCVPKKN